MNRQLRSGLTFATPALMSIASWFVPPGQRKEWLAEWRSEFWHVSHEATEEQALHFAAGALQDALCLWCEQPWPRPTLAFRRGSAASCLAVLALLAVTGLLACILLPNARRVLLMPASAGEHSVVITTGFAGIHKPVIRYAEYERWTSVTHRIFSSLAFFSPQEDRIYLPDREAVTLHVAHASRGMIHFLGLPAGLRHALRSARGHQPELLLTSHALERLAQNGSLHSGAIVLVNGKKANFAGIAPESAWPLSATTDAWLIESAAQPGAFPANAPGFVIGRPRAGYNAMNNGWWLLIIPRAGTASASFNCIALKGILHLPGRIFLYSLLLALLALPATTPLRLGEYPAGSTATLWNLRRALFFSAKALLIMAAVGCWSIVIAYAMAPVGATASVCLQLAFSLISFLCAFRWAWQDQRNRCPVCLQRLANPARVGHASQIFLGWSGTEWVCTRGHGLLHIPALPTSWLSLQRWLEFDSSWNSLFPSDLLPENRT